MKRTCLMSVATVTLALLFCVPTSVRADDLLHVKLHYQVQPDSTTLHWEATDYAELTLKPGMSGSAFLGNAGVTLVVATAGQRQYLVDLTLTTLPPAAQVVTRQFVIDRQQDIEVGGLHYEIRYNSRVTISIHPYRGDLSCDFTHDEGARSVDEYLSDIPFHGAPSMINDTIVALGDELWYVDPSAHFELYFIPNTLGDFGWNLVRDFLEAEFNQFNNAFNLKRAQRINFFISPCKVPEISWMPNRDWAIHPTTFKAYGVFNRDNKSVAGVPVNLNYFYRYLGYAPMCLAEGAARAFEYDHYYAKKLKWRDQLPRPSEWWTNIKYKSYPDSGLYIAAGSFVQYILQQHGVQKWFQLYGIANDFNADSAFTGVYGTSFRKLEEEWLGYLDTLRVNPQEAMHHVGRSKVLGRHDESIALINVLVEVDKSDVSDALDQLALLYFLEGRYEETVETIERMTDRYRTADRIMQMRNSALFFDGKVDLARSRFAEHRKRDNLPALMHSAICLLSGWLELTEGNLERADSLFSLPERGTKGTAIDQVEMALHRAAIHRQDGRHEDADSLYIYTKSATQQLLQARPAAGDLYLRLSEAYIGLGQPDTALIYLDVAEFLEYRPYYVGRILVALGNAYDLLGMRDQATAFYREVMEVPTSYPARVEARKYLREPYQVTRSL
jgi:tetratricopeptide (TPR) repeat protein